MARGIYYRYGHLGHDRRAPHTELYRVRAPSRAEQEGGNGTSAGLNSTSTPPLKQPAVPSAAHGYNIHPLLDRIAMGVA